MKRVLTGLILIPTFAYVTLWAPLQVFLAVAAIVAGILVLVERRLETCPEFTLGLLPGELAVLLSLALNLIALLFGGEVYMPIAAEVLFIAHLPIAVAEGIILGFTVGFLARVKPTLLGIKYCPRTPN